MHGIDNVVDGKVGFWFCVVDLHIVTEFVQVAAVRIESIMPKSNANTTHRRVIPQ